MKIGILALQGDFTQHAAVLHTLKAEPVLVRLPEDLSEVRDLIIPGGESTTIGKLLESSKLGDAIKEKAKEGLPIYGTCAGAIMLAKHIKNYPHQYRLDLMDIEIDRNAYGRQLDSFETTLIFEKKPVPVLFIRAPKILSVGKNVEVLIEHEGEPVLVREGNLLAGMFHPEITGSAAIHEYFLKLARE